HVHPHSLHVALPISAYCFSAAIAGVAGALLAQNTQFVGLEMIGFNRSAEILIVLILGGTGRLYGGIIGAILYMCVHEFFADLNRSEEHTSELQSRES